jgi:Predicted ester cyclase
MRTFSFSLALAITLCGCASHSAPVVAIPPAAPSAEAAYRLLFEQGLTHRDTTALNAALAPELTMHVADQSVKLPRSQVLAIAHSILVAFPDIQFRIELVVTEGNMSAARLRFTGTHNGAWHGIAPTGRRVTVTEMFFCRSEGGRLAECWQEWDEAGLREQLTAAR